MKKILYTIPMMISVLTWTLFPLSARADLQTNLESCWALEEASGTREDSYGANDFTAVATVTNSAQVVGNGAVFNVGWLQLADNTSISVSGDFTWAGWVKTNVDQTFQGFVNKANEYLLSTVGDDIGFKVWDSSSGNTIATANLNLLSSYHYVVAWYDSGDKKAHIQIDNGTVIDAPTAITNGPIDGASTLYFGIEDHDFTRGNMDEWGFWKRVLTSDERTSLYNAGAGTACPFTPAPPAATGSACNGFVCFNGATRIEGATRIGG